MIATIRDRKGQGNAALYVRLRNSLAQYWNFTTQTWVASEVPACRVFLTEYPDASTLESRYQTTITIPIGQVIVEYVRLEDEFVIGEEETSGDVQVAGIGSNQLTVTVTDGINPVPSVLVQAFQGGNLVASSVTDTLGKVYFGLALGQVNLTLTKPSFGTFPSTTYTVVDGAQSITVAGTAGPPPPAAQVGFALLIPVADVTARMQMGYSTLEVWASDDEARTWKALTAPIADSTHQVHIPLQPAKYSYEFLDPQGTSTRRYRWRYSANGVAPFSPYSPNAYAKNLIVGDVMTSIAYGRFISPDGRPLRKTIIIAAEGSQDFSGYTMGDGDTLSITADDYGFIQTPLVRGSQVRVALEGTSIIRVITVPDTATFDILAAVSQADDMFTIQTTAPMVTRRSL